MSAYVHTYADTHALHCRASAHTSCSHTCAFGSFFAGSLLFCKLAFSGCAHQSGTSPEPVYVEAEVGKGREGEEEGEEGECYHILECEASSSYITFRYERELYSQFAAHHLFLHRA